MDISFCNGNDKAYQKRLNALLKQVFFDFQFWYDLNLWDDNYESYAIIDRDEVLSNICVYKTKVRFNNKTYDALSIGAVATAKEHRGKGYSRALMEHILEKYQNVPMYLSANDTVVDFYPKFGFRRVYEKLPVFNTKIENAVAPVKLPYNHPKVWSYIRRRTNFSKRLDCLNTDAVNLFHLYAGSLKDCIYEIPPCEALLIAEKTGGILKIKGLFSEKTLSFAELAPYLPFRGVEKVEFGFMPDWLGIACHFTEADTDPYFVRGVHCDLGDFKFPELSLT